MNKLITTDTGGFPYVLDDIRFEQDAYRNAFLALASAVRNSATGDYILYGCNVTDNTTNFDVSAGAVVFDGEIYLFAGATNLTKVSLLYLLIKPSTSTYDSAGLKTFQDASTHDTYNLRFATASISALGGTYIQLSTAGTSAIPLKLDYKFHNFLGIGDKITLADAAYDGTGSYEATYSGATVPLKFWKRGNMVELEGGIKHNAGVTPAIRTHLATLPSGYRPSHVVFIYGYSYGGDDVALFEIGTDGKIYVRGDISTSATINTTTGIVLNGSFSI